jgi:hypothetical protein
MEAVPETPKPFGIAAAIQLIVATAARAGTPIEQSFVLHSLHAAFPQSRLPDTALERALKEAAGKARVMVSSTSPRSTGFIPSDKSAGAFEILQGQPATETDDRIAA